MKHFSEPGIPGKEGPLGKEARSQKVYLGDGVYAEFRGEIVLTSENGIEISNTIYLSEETLECLDLYREKVFGK